MKVTTIDERRVASERTGAFYLVSVYQGSLGTAGSWAVEGHLVEDATLPEVLGWLEEHLPGDCCWALGVVTQSDGSATELAVSWIVGADVLNGHGGTPQDERLVVEMLTRRSSVAIEPERR